MADSKITALTAISTVDPTADPLVIVDVSDTSMAASGTTKKSTINQLLGSGGTATLASATITGAATVGTTLGVTGVSTFAAGTVSLPALTTTGDTNTGIYYPAADTFAVTTGGTERFRAHSFGFGVGLTPINGNGKLQVLGGDVYDGQFTITAQLSDVTTSAAKGVLIGYNNTTNNGIISAAYGNGTEGLQFWTHNNSSWGQRMTLTAAGDLSLANGNLVMATSGKGIDFSATANSSGTMTSELLNDYEEGTWTGTLKGSVSDPTIPVTATGAYTKVGRLVTVTIRYINVVTTGASGDVTITGLPFSGAENSAGSAIAFSMFTTSTTLACWNNGTTIAFYVSGAFTPATHSAGVSRSVTVTITYYV